MNCMICDGTTDLVRLSCGAGLHYICVTCNNAWYNTPRQDGSGADIQGTHKTTCPTCRADNTIIYVDRTMVPLVVRNQLRQRVGVTVNRFVPAPAPVPFVGLYDGLPPPQHS